MPQLSPNLITAIVLFGTFLTAAVTIRRWNERVQEKIDKTRTRIAEYLPKANILHLNELSAEFGSLHQVIVKHDRMKAELMVSTRLVLLAPFFSFVPLLVVFLNEQAFSILAGVLYLLAAILVIAAYALTSIANSTLHDLGQSNPAILKGRTKRADEDD